MYDQFEVIWKSNIQWRSNVWKLALEMCMCDSSVPSMFGYVDTVVWCLNLYGRYIDMLRCVRLMIETMPRRWVCVCRSTLIRVSRSPKFAASVTITGATGRAITASMSHRPTFIGAAWKLQHPRWHARGELGNSPNILNYYGRLF